MFKLHDYQTNLVNKTRQSYADGFKTPCVVAPCGAGKSVIIAEIARMTTANGKCVLFLVHRRELIDQIREAFINNDVDIKLVDFGMVQTIVKRLEKTKKPDLIITDENHHSLAASYKKIYDYFNDVLRLGFTATPVRLNGSGLGDVNDILIEEVNAEWLIKNSFLSPYKYYAPKLIDTELLKISSLQEFSSGSIDKAMDDKTIYGDVVKHYKKLADGEQAIVYCHSVAASNFAKEEFINHGIIAEHIDAKTGKIERDEIVAKFKNKEIKVLCNVDLIGEGFDVPDCSTVIMLRPTQSLSLFIQQSMRGMRFKPGKTSIIIDHVGNAHRHGLPDTERQWSLNGGKKSSGDAEIKIKSCLNCFAVYPSLQTKCPECGHKPEVKQIKDYEVDKSAELQEITKDDIDIKLDFRSPEDCKNMGELIELGKNRGYKKGWSYHQGKLLGLV